MLCTWSMPSRTPPIMCLFFSMSSVSLPLVLPLSTTFNITLIGHLSHATSISIGSFGFGINYHLLIFPILYLILNSNFSATYGITFFSTLIQLTPVLSTFTVLVIHALLHSFFWTIPCVGGRPSTLLLNQVYHYCILSLPVGVLSIYNNNNNNNNNNCHIVLFIYLCYFNKNRNNVDNALVQYNLFSVYNLDKEGINYFCSCSR